MLFLQKQVLKTIACPCTKIVALRKVATYYKNIKRNKLLKIIKTYSSEKVVKYYKKYCSEKVVA